MFDLGETVARIQINTTSKALNGKGKFLCSAVSGPQDCSIDALLHFTFPDRPAQSDNNYYAKAARTHIQHCL